MALPIFANVEVLFFVDHHRFSRVVSGVAAMSYLVWLPVIHGTVEAAPSTWISLVVGVLASVLMIVVVSAICVGVSKTLSEVPSRLRKDAWLVLTSMALASFFGGHFPVVIGVYTWLVFDVAWYLSGGAALLTWVVLRPCANLAMIAIILRKTRKCSGFFDNASNLPEV
jgi:hypothetical protein